MCRNRERERDGGERQTDRQIETEREGGTERDKERMVNDLGERARVIIIIRRTARTTELEENLRDGLAPSCPDMN